LKGFLVAIQLQTMKMTFSDEHSAIPIKLMIDHNGWFLFDDRLPRPGTSLCETATDNCETATGLQP
jgi:hypothetical protein